mgnify:CR=1 FL=1
MSETATRNPAPGRATLSRTGLAGGGAAFGVSLCCVLPMILMLAGLGGSWIAVFGRIAALGYWVAGGPALLLTAGWVLTLWRGAGRGVRLRLAADTALTGLAWGLLVFETRLNDMLIEWM